MSESTVRKQEDLDEELCKYCTIPKECQGMHMGPNGPYGCEGCLCHEAYENFLDEQTYYCDMCGVRHDIDHLVTAKRLDSKREVYLCIECSDLPDIGNTYEV